MHVIERLFSHAKYRLRPTEIINCIQTENQWSIVYLYHTSLIPLGLWPMTDGISNYYYSSYCSFPLLHEQLGFLRNGIYLNL